tara:strand:- start:112 stop:651 length:540 start_codon:yes stop_codon:yes gene_type:complete
MFEKFLKESFESHLEIARKIIKEEKADNNKFYKFGFFDFDDTLYEKEGNYIIESTDQYRKIVELLEDPEPCYIAIVTARRSDTKDFVFDTLNNNLQDLLEVFQGKFEIKTVLDNAVEDKPSIYEVSRLKAEAINNIITNNSDNLQETLVYFYDDIQENVEEVAKELDKLNIDTSNCFIV